MRSTRILLIAAGLAAALVPALAKGPTFQAEYTFRGSNLGMWRTLGQADWRADNGEITGTPRQPGGGWLILDASMQDVAFYASVLCPAGCQSGVLLRAEATADGGLTGAFMSLTEGDLATYALTTDAQGAIVSREPLMAPQPAAGAAAGGRAGGGGGGGGGGGRGGAAAGPPALSPDLAARFPGLVAAPTGAHVPGEWNDFEMLLFGNTLRPKFNGGGRGGPPNRPVPETLNNRAGRIALYTGGTAPVRLKDLQFKDLLSRRLPAEQLSRNFRMQRLAQIYYGWGAAVADFNRDGALDVAAGAFYYPGPAFTEAREMYTPVAYVPISQYPTSNMINLADDFTRDGWPDLLVITGGAGVLYVNPQGQSRHWRSYEVLRPVNNDDTMLKDVDGDGRLEVIHAGNNTLRYSRPDPANPTGTWITTTISEPGLWGANLGHGLGIGDINGDGRNDYLSSYGWWEQPAQITAGMTWTHHPEQFGRWQNTGGNAGGAELAIYDVNGDRLNDVVTALEGHGFGLAWYEQKRDARGAISFVEHMIMDNFLTQNAGDVIFTELHAAAAADIDGDRIPDFVTGKRYMSLLTGGPDPYGAPVLYVYKTRRNAAAPGGAEFVPELIHNRSGVGSRIAVADLNRDGTNDIVTAGAFGTFVFLNTTR